MESIVRCIPPSRPPCPCHGLRNAAAGRRWQLRRPKRESCCFQILLAAAAAAVSITSRQPVGQDDGLNGGHGRLPIFSTVDRGSVAQPGHHCVRNRLVPRMLDLRSRVQHRPLLKVSMLRKRAGSPPCPPPRIRNQNMNCASSRLSACLPGPGTRKQNSSLGCRPPAWKGVLSPSPALLLPRRNWAPDMFVIRERGFCTTAVRTIPFLSLDPDSRGRGGSDPYRLVT